MTESSRRPRLAELGERICILGPSNSGKSTLAVAIAAATGLPVVHLDVLRHVPGARWTERDPEEFGRLHDAAVAGERWVIEGNYSRWLPQRLERATGLIVVDVSTPLSLARYVRRTLLERHRHGGLEGVSDRLDLGMVRWIVGGGRRGRAANRERARTAEIPAILLPTAEALRGFYRAEHLQR